MGRKCLDCNCPISSRSSTVLRCRSCANKAWRAGKPSLRPVRPSRQDRNVFDEEQAMHRDFREGSAALLAALRREHPELVAA